MFHYHMRTFILAKKNPLHAIPRDLMDLENTASDSRVVARCLKRRLDNH
jgi:hypothetical protein